MEGLTPQQTEFLAYYLDPKSGTYSNATRSAVKAGYSEDYADNLTSLMPDWLSESIGRQGKIVLKAERNLDSFMDSEDERVKADMTKFVLSRLKKESYSDRQEITGKDGKDIIPTPILDLRETKTVENSNITENKTA